MNKLLKLFGYEMRLIRCDAFCEQRRLLAGKTPAIIFDVGAHSGQTARQYKKLFPAATVYSVEPFPESFAALEQTASQLTGVHAVNVALSDSVGHAEFHSNSLSATNSLLPFAPESAEVWPGLIEARGRVQVPTTTLDAFCDARSIESIDVLKLDVQGAEPLVLRGAQQLLARGAVGMVYTEIITLPTYSMQIELHQFLEMMRSYGFELHNFYNSLCTGAGQLRQIDAIFVPTRSLPTPSIQLTAADRVRAKAS